MIALTTLAATLLSTVAIENVKVEVGDGTVLEKATVLIDRGRITRVGPEVAVPEGAERVNGAGRVLSPGLIEASTRLGVEEISLEKRTVDAALGGPMAPGFRVADGFNASSVWIPVVREEGITSAIVVPSGGLLHGTGAWVDLTGELSSAPDPQKPIAMFGDVGGGAAAATGGSRGGLWLKLREAFADARFYARNRAAVDQGRARQLSLSPTHLEALLPVLDGRLPLVLEAQRAGDILAALRLAREERLHLVISGGAEAWKVAKELATAKVPVIITPSDQLPDSFDKVGARDDLAALLDRAGVPLVLSAGGWASRRIRQEAGIAVAYGLPRPRAIRSIFLAPAEAFGKASELGTVAEGKRANLVLWSGDPLELSTVADKVYIDGVEQSLDTRQRRLVDRYHRKRK